MSEEDITARMASLILKYRSSGQSRKDFAAAHGMSESKLGYWLLKFSKKAGHQASLFGSDHLVIRLPNGVEIQIPM